MNKIKSLGAIAALAFLVGLPDGGTVLGPAPAQAGCLSGAYMEHRNNRRDYDNNRRYRNRDSEYGNPEYRRRDSYEDRDYNN